MQAVKAAEATTAGLEWFKATVPLLAALVQLGAALALAVIGYRFGIRKTGIERGFDRRIEWHETTINALNTFVQALTEAARLEAARAYEYRDGEAYEQSPMVYSKQAAPAWAAVRSALEPLLVALRRARVYADAPGAAACARVLQALRHDHVILFVPLPNLFPEAEPEDRHPLADARGDRSRERAEIATAVHAAADALVTRVRAQLGYDEGAR